MLVIRPNEIFLSEIGPQDLDSFVEHFRDRRIYERTLNIPYPYTESHARWWIDEVSGRTERQGLLTNWAIRDQSEKLVGGIGFSDFEIGKSHKAEVGYWLATSLWGQGIIPDALTRVCEIAFTELGLVRISANVFENNLASSRVLEKCGFMLEGTLRRFYFKDGRYIDGRLYSKIAEIL